MLRDVATVVGVGTGLAALDCHAPASMSAGHIGRKLSIQERDPERTYVLRVRCLHARLTSADLLFAAAAAAESIADVRE